MEEATVACASVRTPVSITTTVALSGLNNQYLNTDAPVTLSGSPAGGTFSGPGVTGNIFDPASAGIGGPYAVAYTFIDSNNCSASNTIYVTVHDVNGISNAESIRDLNIFPNPNSGKFNLTLHSTEIQTINIAVTDAIGRKIFGEENIPVNGNFSKRIDLNGAAKGVYQLTLTSNSKTKNYQLVIE